MEKEQKTEKQGETEKEREIRKVIFLTVLFPGGGGERCREREIRNNRGKERKR